MWTVVLRLYVIRILHSQTQAARKQKTAPRNLLNLATSHNLATPLLHKFYLITTQILAYTPTQHLPTRLPHGLNDNDGARIYFGSTSLAASTLICEDLVVRKYETAHHNLPQPHNTTFLHEFVLATT